MEKNLECPCPTLGGHPTKYNVGKTIPIPKAGRSEKRKKIKSLPAKGNRETLLGLGLKNKRGLPALNWTPTQKKKKNESRIFRGERKRGFCAQTNETMVGGDPCKRAHTGST